MMRRCLIGVVAATAVLGGVVFIASAPAGPSITSTGGGTRAAANKAAAESDAPRLLSRLVLPSGSTRLASEPAGDHSQLASCSCPATPNLIDAHGWWRVPERLGEVISFVDAHRPAGTRLVVTGGGRGPGYSSKMVTFAFAPVAGVLATRWLAVNATTLPDGSTGVRADGASVWVTPRPASEVIPPAKRLRITVVRGPKLLQPPITVRSQRKVRRVVGLLNRLPAAQPGISSCPSDPGIRVVLDFYGSARARTPSAVATIVVGGCGGVLLRLHGRPQPALGDPPLRAGGRYVPLEHRVARIIGTRLRTTVSS
jgi:hypothetical protein